MTISDGKAGVIGAISKSLRGLTVAGSCALKRFWHGRHEAKVASTPLCDDDDAAMAQMDWVIKGDLLQALLAHCPDESVRAQVSLRGYPLAHHPFQCHAIDFVEMMDTVGVSHRDPACADLCVATLQQLHGDILQRMQGMVMQMMASLAAQIVQENAEKHHLPQEWSLPNAEFPCLQGNDAFTTAVREMQWETTDLSVPYRPWFDIERWNEIREMTLDVDRTYVRRVLASQYDRIPVMPITNEQTIEAALRYEEDESE